MTIDSLSPETAENTEKRNRSTGQILVTNTNQWTLTTTVEARRGGATGDSRGEDAVADDHGRPEQSEQQQQPLQLPALLQRRAHGRRRRRAVALLLEVVVGSATVADAREEARTDPAAYEGVEREGAALAVVVGAEDDAEKRDGHVRSSAMKRNPSGSKQLLGWCWNGVGELAQPVKTTPL